MSQNPVRQYELERGQGLVQYAALPCLLIFTGIVFIVVFFVALAATGDAPSSLLAALCSVPLSIAGLFGLIAFLLGGIPAIRSRLKGWRARKQHQ